MSFFDFQSSQSFLNNYVGWHVIGIRCLQDGLLHFEYGLNPAIWIFVIRTLALKLQATLGAILPDAGKAAQVITERLVKAIVTCTV
jgi:hypothetical protein